MVAYNTSRELLANHAPGGENYSGIFPQTFIVHQSIFFIIIKLISIEILFDVVYLILRVPPVYLHLTTRILSFLLPIYFFVFIILTAIKLFLIISTAIKWTANYYELCKGEIRYVTGIFFHKEKVYRCTYTQEVDYTQNIIGRIFNYGTIEIYNPAMKEKLFLYAIPNPKRYATIIKNLLPEDPHSNFINIQ